MGLQDIGKWLEIQKEHLVVQLIIFCTALKDSKLLVIQIIREIELCVKQGPHKYPGLPYCRWLIPKMPDLGYYDLKLSFWRNFTISSVLST